MAGKVLLAEANPVVQMYANQLSSLETTYNVICDSLTGSKEDVIVMGAHLGIPPIFTPPYLHNITAFLDFFWLDSVPEGPGLNDNV